MELEEAIKNVRKFNQENRYRDCGKINNSIDMVLQALENFIPKEKVEKGIDRIEDYFDRLNEPDEDIDFIKEVKQELLEE
ncbi:MAG: hypothetical protein HFJ30_00075 [Clostridia bacterium]|jgi:hypothetical protein|nr:hypothetical protein [Clostridia bacterium]